MRRAVPPPVNVEFMTAATAASQPVPLKAEGRSPFVRLHELLADIKPGKPAINLSVGEPQHPIPPFVGPVLAGPSQRFRPLSGQQGHRAASARPPPPGSAGATGSPRAVDPETEVIVLNGTREGLFLGAIAAKRYVPRARRQARDPDPQSVLRRLCGRRGRRRIASRSICRRRAQTGFLPDLDAHRRRAARAHRRVLSRLAVQPAGRGRRRRLSRRGSSALARRYGFLVFADECYCEIYLNGRAAARHAGGCRGRTSPTSWCSTRCRSAPTCRACASASPPATAASSPATSSCATSRRRRCRCRRRRSRSPPMATRPMSRENRELYVAKFDLADQIIGDRYGYQRPAGGFFLWLDVSAHGGDEAVDGRSSGARRACASSPAAISRATAPTAAIPAPATSASPWCRTRKPPPRRCTASSRCSADRAGNDMSDLKTWQPSTAASSFRTGRTTCAA